MPIARERSRAREDRAIDAHDASRPTSEELRHASDALLRDLDALGELEDEKRRTPQGDPRLVELAARIEELAHRVLLQSRKQVVLSQSVNAAAGDGPDAVTTIEATKRPAHEVLAAWRQAEREAQAAEPGSVDASEARARADRLRDEYREAFEAAARSTGL